MEQKKNNFKIVSDKKARMILPNAITLIGVCIGLTSIKFAIDGKFAIAIIGVRIFVCLTAYDTQKMKNMYSASDSGALIGKKAVMCALTLYLDFINLFIMLLRLFGQRR